jgi:hypothetical protein
MKGRSITLIFFLLLISTHGFAQNINLWGILPSISYQKALNNYLNLNLNTDSQINAIERNYDEQTYPAMMNNMNFTAGIGYQYSPKLHLAASFMLRLQEPFTDRKLEYELRPWQQLTLIHRLEKYRIRNQFRIEQRVFTGQENNFDIRLRYRLSNDFPLSGEKIDVGEAYINLSYEILSMPTREEFLYFNSQRPYMGIGFILDEYNRLEIGPEFRTQRINESFRENVYFMRVFWSYNR